MESFNREKTIFLIDGNAYIHRAYHALPLLTTSSKMPINAVFGFVRMLLKLLKNYDPKYLCICFDSSKPTFRHNMFPDYKSTRKKIDDELKIQFPLVYEMVSDVEIRSISIEGYEADDVISVLAKRFSSDGNKIVIISGDKDILQIVNSNIVVYNEQKNLWYDERKVMERYGIPPYLLADYFAFLGDKIDNIPGVAGVGEKTALKLIKEFGSVESVYSNLDKIEPKLKQKLLQEKDNAFKSKKLVTLVSNIDVLPEFELKNLELNINFEKFILFLSKYEMKSLITEVRNFKQQKDANSENNKNSNLSVNQLGFEFIAKNNLDKTTKKNDNVTQEFSDYLILKSEKEISFLKNIIENESKELVITLISNIQNQIVGMIGLSVSKLKNDKNLFFYMPLVKNETSTRVIIEPVNLKKLIEFLLYLFSIKEPTFKIISYNFKHQLVLLKNFDLLKNLVVENLFDIQIASYLLNPTKNNYSLQNVVNENLEDDTPILNFCLPQDFDITSFPIEKFLFRTKHSLEVIHYVYENQSLKLLENNLTDLFYKIEVPLLKVIAKMELTGIKVDLEYLLSLKEEITKKIFEIKNIIFNTVGIEFNLNSPKQLSFFLFEKLKLPPVKKKKTGYSTDEEVLHLLQNMHPIVPLLLEYRELEKLKNTYIEPFINFVNNETKRIYTTFNITGTSTGRLSSENPNLQNIPARTIWGRKIREMFIAEEGFKLVSFDYSQIELRILAHFSNDNNLISAFRNNEDIHLKTAMKIFKLEREKITSEHRRIAKTINFGIIYGISAQGLAKELNIDIKTAQEYIDNYFREYNSVKEWILKTIESTSTTFCSRTLFNRYRPIDELRSSNFNLKSFGQRLSINSPIQGTAADIIKLAMIKVDEYLEKNFEKELCKIRMLLQIHDELLFEIKEEILENVVPKIKNIMEKVVDLNVPLVVNYKISNRWEKD